MQETIASTIEVGIAGMTALYQAIMQGDWEGMKRLLDADKVGVVTPLTVNKDTALHIAIYSGNTDLADHIIDIANEVAEHTQDTLTQQVPLVKSPFLIQNEYGNTALHEAAATGNVKAAKRLLQHDEKLLEIKNKLGETPIYKAAAFGNTEMVMFLTSEIEKNTETMQTYRRRGRGPFMGIHDRRDDSTSILHISVQGEHFEVALWLQEKDEALGALKDQNGRTCLHLLANMPSAYKSGQAMGKWKTFLYSWLMLAAPSDGNNQDDNREPQESSTEKAISRSRYWANLFLQSSYSKVRKAISRMCGIIQKCLVEGWPVIDKILKEKKRHESVMKLTKLLVSKDTSWEQSYTQPDTGTISFGTGRSKGLGLAILKRYFEVEEDPIAQADPPSTPLLIASRTGIIEIVDEILSVYPQAVDHVSNEGQNILHVAIKHRQRDIFRRVKKMTIPLFILVRKIDKKGNTILHHAAHMQNPYGRQKPTPALQLQEELLWFERVRKIIPSHYVKHHNEKDQSAIELFAMTHSDLHKEAQEWLKRTSESCSVIAVLIATVAFTAVYTVPGGTDNDTGLPILLHYPFFSVFTVLDIMSLASSLTSLVMFLSILTSPFQLQDFHSSLPRKLTLGFTFLFIAVAATMLAFAATIVLEIRLKQHWTRTIIYTVAFLPVTMFALLQFPLYLAFTGAMKRSFNVFRKALPWNYVYRLFNITVSSIRKAHWTCGRRAFHRV